MKLQNYLFVIWMLAIIQVTNAQSDNLINWSFETKGKILSHPILDGNVIYFGSLDSNFYSVDIESGKQVWSFNSRWPIRSKAIIKGNTVFFKSGNNVFALNKKTGEPIWSNISTNESAPVQIDYWDYHSGAPAIYKKSVFFGLSNGLLNAFDLKTGKLKWQLVNEDSAAIHSGLIIENNILYYGDWNGKIHSYNLDTKKELWVYKTFEKRRYATFGQINTGLFSNKELLFFGGRNPELQVINKTTGEKAWTYIEKEGGWISGDPVVVNDTLYIGGSDNHEMFAMNANTGELYWNYKFLFNNFSKIIPYHNYILFTTGDAYSVYGSSQGHGYLYGLNKIDGSIRNVSLIGGNIYTNPIIKKDIIYLGSEDKHLYAINLKNFLKEETTLKERGYNSIAFINAENSPFVDSLKMNYKTNCKTALGIRVTDLSDREIITLYQGTKRKGEYSLSWNGKDANGDFIPAGYYFIHIRSGEQVKKIFIQKK